MNHYQLNRDILLEKAKDKYHKGGIRERAAEYNEDNKQVLREKARNKCINMSEKEKKLKTPYGDEQNDSKF